MSKWSDVLGVTFSKWPAKICFRIRSKEDSRENVPKMASGPFWPKIYFSPEIDKDHVTHQWPSLSSQLSLRVKKWWLPLARSGRSLLFPLTVYFSLFDTFSLKSKDRPLWCKSDEILPKTHQKYNSLALPSSFRLLTNPRLEKLENSNDPFDLLFIYILKINYFNLNDFYFIGMNSNAKGTNFTKVGVLLLL